MEDASDLLRLATGISRKHHHLPCAVFGRAMKAGDLCSQSRSEEHTSELQSLMRISYAVFCLKKKNTKMQMMIGQSPITTMSRAKHNSTNRLITMQASSN